MTHHAVQRFLRIFLYPLVLSSLVCGVSYAADSPPIDIAPDTTTAKVRLIRDDLERPWALAFLPDRSILITEIGNRLLKLSPDGLQRTEIRGLPDVATLGQGGLLDVAVDPDFETQAWVYLTYTERDKSTLLPKYGTAVARGRLVGNALVDLAVIFRQSPKTSGGGHFGSRLAFAKDKTLFITLGERQLKTPAQDLTQSLGKVVRINRDGSIPKDNPRLGESAIPGLWSLGHRNPQGAAIHPTTGELWISEHGPQGGDEINIARSSKNYGWPNRSYGCNYGQPAGSGCRLGGGTHAPDYEEPVTFWEPTSIAPSGLMFYQGRLFPKWKGNLFSGSLAGQALWRLELDGNRVVKRQRLLSDLKSRIRDVREAPDGSIVVLTDAGQLLRLVPAAN
jgi:glucose/arabinose dehydrogenase